MAKVAFSKLALKKQDNVKLVKIGNFDIEVKQYLPVNEKLDLIARVLNGAHDENNFPNPIKIEVIGTLEIIMAYTNISFTEKQKEDVAKLYDLLDSNGVVNTIIINDRSAAHIYVYSVASLMKKCFQNINNLKLSGYNDGSIESALQDSLDWHTELSGDSQNYMQAIYNALSKFQIGVSSGILNLT